MVEARSAATTVVCPTCGATASRVHGRYQRTLRDFPLAGTPVVIRLTVRRFICDVPACARQTFAEQVPGLTTPHARYSPPLRQALTAIAAALAGRADARLAGGLGMTASRDTLLNLLRAVPDPQPGTVEILGIDDFSLRRGQVYGTVLLDMTTGQPVDVLPGRDAGPVTDWLRAHPSVRIVCRDRAGAYAAAVREGAPQAIECADRWHLWHNLAEHVQRAVTGHHGCLKRATPSRTADAPPAEPAVMPVMAEPEPPTAADDAEQPATAQAAAGQAGQESLLVTRIRQRYAAIKALQADGHGLREIARQMNLDRKTVRRFAQAASADDLTANTLDRVTLLEAHQSHLHQRWNQGCHDVRTLHAELRQRGYRGSIRTLYRHLQPLRALDPSPATAPGRLVPPAPPKIRHVTNWLLRRPEDLDEAEKATLADIRNACPHLDRLADHITAFAKMMVHRTGADTLDTWLAAAEADDIPELHTFARGIRQDYAAVRNGLSLPYNSGACEGSVNKLKTVKRQMYGRASFSLLRKRILLNV